MGSHLGTLLRLHPRGACTLDDGSLSRLDLEVVAWLLDSVVDQNELLRLELRPDSTVELLEDWERVFGIKRIAGKSDARRRAAIMARKRFLPDFRRVTIEDILETLTTLDVTIVEPGPFRCDDPSSVCGGDRVVDGAFTFFAEFDESSARTLDLSRDEIQETLEDLRPAHTYGAVRCDDFSTDDPWSLCDMDLIGA